MGHPRWTTIISSFCVCCLTPCDSFGLLVHRHFTHQRLLHAWTSSAVSYWTGLVWFHLPHFTARYTFSAGPAHSALLHLLRFRTPCAPCHLPTWFILFIALRFLHLHTRSFAVTIHHTLLYTFILYSHLPTVTLPLWTRCRLLRTSHLSHGLPFCLPFTAHRPPHGSRHAPPLPTLDLPSLPLSHDSTFWTRFSCCATAVAVLRHGTWNTRFARVAID